MARVQQYEIDREKGSSVIPVQIQEQLGRILASDLFLNSQRLSAFLRFIVECSLRGRSEQIKEYLIGTEVFGRSESYDPRTDPVVRVEAGRLRAKLAEYYRGQGQHDSVLIELPKGRYVPIFQERNGTQAIQSLALEEKPASRTRVSPGRLWTFTALAGLAVLAAGLIYLLRLRSVAQPASIAVLPFVNLSADSEYLGDGVADELTTALAQLNSLRVVAATSAFQFRGKPEDVRKIGQQLNARALLEGSVSRTSGSLRINAQLVSTENGYHLWSKIYDVEAGGLFDAEEDIVRRIARALQLPIEAGRNLRPPHRETRDAEAHDLYMQGRYFWSKRDLPDMERAIALFQAATQRDPSFALAYAGLADTYVVIGGNAQKPLSEVVPPAKAALARALELDPSLAEIHATQALLNSEASGQRRQLEPELRRAVELSPGYASAHHWLGLILTGQKRFEEADAELRKAQILDPLTPIITEGVAENYYTWRRYDDAIMAVDQLRKMNSTAGEEVLGRVYVQKGMYQEAIEQFKHLHAQVSSPHFLAELAIAYSASGQKEEARGWLEQAVTPQKSYVSPFWIAVAYAQLGDQESAFRWLERAYEQKDPLLGTLMCEPLLDPIRSDPRYTEMLRKADLIP